MRNRSRLFLLIATLWAVVPVSAQVGQSPYSINGIGDLQSRALANQFGMAEVGIASPTRFHINNQNPALLTYNKLSTFQMGVAVDYRGISSEDESQTNGGALLNNLVFSFPVMKNRWTMSIGLLPLTNVNFNVIVVGQVDNSSIPITRRFEGDGGLVQAYISHGIVIAKGLSVGITGSYIFGSIDDISSSFVGFSRADLLGLIEQGVEDPFFSSYSTQFTRQNTFGDVTLGMGLHYRYEMNEDTRFNVGMTLDPQTNISGATTTFFARRDLNNSLVNGTDSTLVNVPGSYRLPNRFGIGFAYEKLLKLVVGLDINYQTWSNAREFDGTSDGFRDALKIAVGADWIPNIGSIDTYFERVSYRLGFSYEESPYLVANSKVNDLGINFGLSFPVGEGSSFDLGVRFGQRGNFDNNPIRERFVKALVGVTINDRWFIKRRFD